MKVDLTLVRAVSEMPDWLLDFCCEHLTFRGRGFMCHEAHDLAKNEARHLGVVAWTKNHPIGWLIEDWEHKVMIFVAPEYRHRGVATTLYRTACFQLDRFPDVHIGNMWISEVRANVIESLTGVRPQWTPWTSLYLMEA